MRGDAFVLLAAQRVLHPGVALVARLPLEENGAQLPLLRERIDRRLVQRFVLLVEKREELLRRLRGHLGENLVRCEHGWDEKESGESREALGGCKRRGGALAQDEFRFCRPSVWHRQLEIENWK